MSITLEDVPLGTRRRVAQLLENIRETEMDPTGGKARLTGEVTAIYRPDLQDVAYFEFAVDLGRGGKGQRAVLGDGGGLSPMALPARTGFIIATNGAHDHPISHWSLDREPPSRQLAASAEAKDTKLERVFKLDALSYVGEDTEGNMAAQSGQVPMPIEGLPEDMSKAAGKISSVLARPAEGTEDDKTVGDAPHAVQRRGAKPRKVSFRAVKSWAELRDSYGDSFGPLLKDLERRAAPAWEIEALVEKLGEGILTGTTHRVALLEADAMVDLSGEGADLVEVKPMGQALVLSVKDVALDQEVSFDLHIAYGSGGQETLKFFAVSPSTPSNRKPDGGLRPFEEE